MLLTRALSSTFRHQRDRSADLYIRRGCLAVARALLACYIPARRVIRLIVPLFLNRVGAQSLSFARPLILAVMCNSLIVSHPEVIFWT